MNMKTKLLFAAAFVLAGSQTFAQQTTLKSGLRLQAGVNLANISVTDKGRVNDAKQLTSFQVGVVGDIPLVSIVHLQPGVLFTGKGSKTQFDAGVASYESNFNPYYVEVPVNVVLKLPIGSTGGFFIGAGPYVAAGVAGKNKVNGQIAGIDFNSERKIRFSNDDPTTLDTQEDAGFAVVRRFDYGLNGTAGIEGKSVVVGVNYGLGLAKLQSTANSSSNDNNKNRVFSVIVGIKL